MNTNQIIEAMMANAGINGAELSRVLGRTPGYIAALLSRGSVPRLDTFIQMAEAMGFEVVLKNQLDERKITLTQCSEERGAEPSKPA